MGRDVGQMMKHVSSHDKPPSATLIYIIKMGILERALIDSLLSKGTREQKKIAKPSTKVKKTFITAPYHHKSWSLAPPSLQLLPSSTVPLHNLRGLLLWCLPGYGECLCQLQLEKYPWLRWIQPLYMHLSNAELLHRVGTFYLRRCLLLRK